MRTYLRDFFLKLIGFWRKPKAGIHIINSHYITPNSLDLTIDYQVFEDFLKNLQKKSKFISLQEAVEQITDKSIPIKEVLIAFTFDDGFEECHSVIAPLLEKYNCRGAFFINANYIECDDDYQREFNKRIVLNTKKPMSWKQVIDLHNRGHLIGSHNLDHKNFAELNEAQLEFQLKENKEILEKKLNYNCEYFAWTYGQFQHFPKEAFDATLKYHKYIFSGTNYKNYLSMNDMVYNRRHIEAFWPKEYINYFLSVKKTF